MPCIWWRWCSRINSGLRCWLFCTVVCGTGLVMWRTCSRCRCRGHARGRFSDIESWGWRRRSVPITNPCVSVCNIDENVLCRCIDFDHNRSILSDRHHGVARWVSFGLRGIDTSSSFPSHCVNCVDALAVKLYQG